jgi:hypothetical protein
MEREPVKRCRCAETDGHGCQWGALGLGWWVWQCLPLDKRPSAICVPTGASCPWCHLVLRPGGETGEDSRDALRGERIGPREVCGRDLGQGEAARLAGRPGDGRGARWPVR